MSVFTQTLPSSDPAEAHIEFLKLYPIVERHARVVFRARPAQEREEAVADVVAGAFVSYVRLKAQGKDPVADFPSAMATYAVLHVKDERRVGSGNTSRDVFSRKAQIKKGYRVHHMSAGPQAGSTGTGARYARGKAESYADQLQDDMQTPVPDLVAFRIDFPAFLETLPDRDRRLAHFLSLGHSGKAAAARFGISPGRVTQLRKDWQQNWLHFCEERPAPPTD